MDKTKIDLDAPAFGARAQKLEDLINDAHAQETSVEEKPIIKEEVVDDIETSVEENKVPYSRFKNIHTRALEAEAEAEKWRQRAEEIEQKSHTRYENTDSESIPSYWVELYGDSDASQKAWKIQQRREEEIEQRAYEAGQRGARELEMQQQQKIESNVATIDENFEDLSAYIGRTLTAKEQSAILDIVDDYTAKDNSGNYLGEIMPFDKAWEIYELKQNSSKYSQRRDRDTVASLTGTSSQGDTDSEMKKNESWNPLARGTWRNRL